MTDSADVRCPHCGALLRAGAQWCTLCYADLRPKQPESEPAAVREPSYAGGASPGAAIDPLTAPLSALEAAAQAIAQHTAPDSDAAAAGPLAGWPCTGCDAVVSFDENLCPVCGTRFLDGARGEPDLLDRITQRGLPTSTQTLIMAGGAVAIIAILVALMYLIGLLV